MITQSHQRQSEMVLLDLEALVPETSIYRKIEEAVDFTFIYEAVEDLYAKDNGRPSLDPVVLFKLVFIMVLDGVKSMRRTCEKIQVDAEYRWFLNLPFGQKTPHFSTFSKNYERRFKDSDIFETIFSQIVFQAMDHGLVDGQTLFTDSTHKKANANKRKAREAIRNEVKKRRLDLEQEINQERLANGEKPFEYQDS